RHGFNHRGHTGQRTESERCVTSRGISCQRTRYLTLAEYQIHARDLDRFGPDAEVNRDTAGTKALEGCGEGLASRTRYQNDLGAAERLQGHSRIGSGTINVVVGTECLGQLRSAGATSNRRHLESHMPGVLHT